jgi:hypothetical protein
MRKFLALTLLLAALGGPARARQAASDTPATKEDIERYLQVMHSKEMMTKVIDAMAKPMHQMIHEQYLKDKDRLPADFETRMNKIMDDYIKSLPFDAMLEAMVPVYQKHFSKADVDALVAFYSTPTGQKLVRELPEITAEAMQNAMPLLRKSMDTMTQRMQDEMVAMEKEQAEKNKKAPQTNN